MGAHELHIHCLGLNHQTASVTLREQLAFTPTRLEISLARLGCGNGGGDHQIRELVILSTCNRVELYAVTAGSGFDPLEAFLSETQNIPIQDFSSQTYRLSDEITVKHLLEVAAGLDSVVIGEPQILGQVTDAYSAARRHGTAGKILSRLFQTAIHAGKRARSETTISHNPASISSVAVSLISEKVHQLEDAQIMVLGAGEMAELAVEALRKRGARQITFGARQVGMVDASGRSAIFTGEDCFDWAGGLAEVNFAIQGNILVSEDTVNDMKAVFLQKEGSLAERLLAALQAGDIAGGDKRGKQSAALLVVKENGSYGGYTDRYIDLRVDDHADPVKELARLLKLHQLYFTGTTPEDVVAIEGVLANDIQNMLYENGFLDRDLTEVDDLLDAIQSYHLIENFDERVQERGFIDKKVVEFMRINK